MESLRMDPENMSITGARRNQAAGEVSVIIPSFNRAGYVLDAVRSVLEQTAPPGEIIVVDDGSTDDTRTVLEPLANAGSIRYVPLPSNRGQAAATNEGIRRAKGRYLGLLDSDDLWVRDKLERQLAVLEDRPDVGLVYGNLLNWDPDTGNRSLRLRGRLPDGDVYTLLAFRRFWISWITVLVRRECLEEVGLFDESLQRHLDRDLSIRMARRYRFAAIQEPIAVVRLHRASTPKDPRDTLPYGEWVRQEHRVVNKLLAAHPDDALLRRRLRARYAYVWGKGYLVRGDRGPALRWFGRSIVTWPFDMRPYVYLPAALLQSTRRELPGG